MEVSVCAKILAEKQGGPINGEVRKINHCKFGLVAPWAEKGT